MLRRARVGHRGFAQRAVFAAVVLLAGAGAAHAQEGVGKKYGTRDPRTCPDATAPTRGAPSPAQAALYVACAQEREDLSPAGSGPHVILISNVRVQVGTGIPFRDLRPGHRPDGDPNGVVYAIRGSYTSSSCYPTSAGFAAGRNCTQYEYKKAEGMCYHTQFGDWSCNMQDLSQPVPAYKQPPPRD